MAFDEFLAADQINASKRHRSEARQASTIVTTSSSSTGSALSSDDEPIRATARPRTHQPTKGSEIPWGSLNRRCRDLRGPISEHEPLIWGSWSPRQSHPSQRSKPYRAGTPASMRSPLIAEGVSE